MEYQILLYARTFTKDYRYIYTSDLLTDSERNHIIRLQSELKRVRHVHSLRGDIGIYPVFLLNFTEASVLLRVEETSYEDSYSREIFASQGMVVEHAYRRHLWFALPYLLLNQQDFLNVFKRLDFDKSDSLVNLISTQSLDLNLVEKTPINPNPNFQELPVSSKWIFADKFSLNAWEELVACLNTPIGSYPQIGFGVNKEIKDLLLSGVSEKPLLPSDMQLQQGNTDLENSIPSKLQSQRDRFNQDYDEMLAPTQQQQQGNWIKKITNFFKD